MLLTILHSAINEDIDFGHARTVIRHQKQGNPRHLFRPAEAAQQHLTEHVPGLFRILQLFARLVGFDHTR